MCTPPRPSRPLPRQAAVQPKYPQKLLPGDASNRLDRISNLLRRATPIDPGDFARVAGITAQPVAATGAIDLSRSTAIGLQNFTPAGTLDRHSGIAIKIMPYSGARCTIQALKAVLRRYCVIPALKISRRYLDPLSTGPRDSETNPSMRPDRLSTEQRDNLRNKNDTLG